MDILRQLDLRPPTPMPRGRTDTLRRATSPAWLWAVTRSARLVALVSAVALVTGCRDIQRHDPESSGRQSAAPGSIDTRETADTTNRADATDGYLMAYARNNRKRLMSKWAHYFEIYERHLSKYRDTEVTLVEIGVAYGGSLQMWKDYLGPKARIIGIDIDPRCARLEEEQVEVFIGDQADRSFWAEFKRKVPKVDVIVDDGGHHMDQQITTFEEMFPHISAHGTYICEDLHTSYWPRYGGAYRGKDTFIEMSKSLIDQLNAWHSEDKARFNVTPFTRSAYSMHYYDSILVVEKRPMQPPTIVTTGTKSF